MLNDRALSLTKISARLLWLGWVLMLIGLFLPVINWPVPDPNMPKLIFLLLPDDNAGGEYLTHAPVKGLILAFFAFSKTLGDASFSLSWLPSLAVTVLVLLALLAPIGLWFHSKKINILLAICYGIGFTTSIIMILSPINAAIIGQGFYFWLSALLLLCVSRILVCISSWKNKHE